MNREETDEKMIDEQVLNTLIVIDKRYTTLDEKERQALAIAIKAISDKSKYRKKAKRYKRKYLELKTAINNIRTEMEALEDETLSKTNDLEIGKVFDNVLDIIYKYEA